LRSTLKSGWEPIQYTEPMRARSSLAVTASLLAVMAASPVAADCDLASFEEELATAPVAFVGAVTALDGPVATFKVLEVWAGDVPPVVEVRGLSDNPDGAFGEDDRQWQAANAYLVFPIVDGDVLRDSICTATNEWTPELEQFRPPDARLLAAEDPEPFPIGLALVAGVIVAVAAISVVAFRRE
jgi:hypothetical protein